MTCCQCQGIEKSFDREVAAKKLARLRTHGPEKTTRLLTAALQAAGVSGQTLLDIGGGVGAVQYDLLQAGVENVTSVDASSAYLNAAQEEARRRGLAGRIAYHFGNFIDLAPEIPNADIVTLDRVVCCFPDMEKLVGLSAQHARRMYGLVFPRDTWWVKLGLALGNFTLWLQRNPFRGYCHPSVAVEAVLKANGFKRQSYRRTLLWQVVTYTR